MSRHRHPEYRVIDKNAFDRPKTDRPDVVPELARWLAARRHHIAIITDYGIMESVTGDPILNLTHSLAVLKQFRGQFALTRPTAEVGAMDLRGGDLTKLIDEKQTSDYRNLCVILDRDSDIPDHIKASIRRQAFAVESQLARLVENTSETVDALKEIWGRLGRDDVNSVTNYSAPSYRSREFLRQDIFAFAFSVQDALVQKAGASLDIEVRSSISFKYALACVAQRLDLLRGGPPQQLAPMKLRNNTIDANYVAYALVFGGFMSGDGRAMRTYRLAKWLEKHLFAVDDYRPHRQG